MQKKLILIALVSLSLGLLTFAQGPLPIISNVHERLEPFSSVIDNPNLLEDPTLIGVNGRYIEVPPSWSYTGVPEVGGLPPYVRRWEEPGYRFDWDWINGEAGFAQDGIQLYGNQRYAVRVAYQTNLCYTGDFPFVAHNLRVYGNLYTADGGLQVLPAQSMQGLENTHEIEWVIESTENPYPFVRLEIIFTVEWPIFIGSTNLQKVDIVTAPSDYRPEALIRFR